MDIIIVRRARHCEGREAADDPTLNYGKENSEFVIARKRRSDSASPGPSADDEATHGRRKFHNP